MLLALIKLWWRALTEDPDENMTPEQREEQKWQRLEDSAW